MHRVNNAYLSTPFRIHDNESKRRDATSLSRKADNTVASTFFFSFSFYAALRVFPSSISTRMFVTVARSAHDALFISAINVA